MRTLSKRYGYAITAMLVSVCLLWVGLLVVAPGAFLVDLSFQPNLATDPTATPGYTIDNYLTLFTNTVHYHIFIKTIWGSALVTLASLIVCYPVAYVMAQVVSAKTAATYMLLLVIPFWINEILRTFAWFIILSYNGPLNQILVGLGILAAPVRYFSSSGSVIAGMVYAYILYMVFPVYNAISTLDHVQIEAARDLGAPPWQIHRRIVIPHAKPGIAVGCIMTFMLAAGSYAVPAILGGPGNRWFTQIIYDWFFQGENWNQGTAYAFLLLLLCMAFILAMMAIFRVRLGDIAK